MPYDNITQSPNKHFSNLSSAVKNERYVGTRFLTPAKSSTQAGAILTEETTSLFEQLQALVDGRATLGEVNVTVQENLYKINSFALYGRTSQQDIWESEALGQDVLMPRERTVRKVTNEIALLEEMFIAKLIFDDANFAGGQTNTATVLSGGKFTSASSDPIKAITTARDSILGAENGPDVKVKVLFGRTAWTAYRNNDNVRKAFQGSTGGGQATLEGPPDAFRHAAAQLEVDEVLVGRARIKTGPSTFADLWTDNVLIGVVYEGEARDSSAFGHSLWWGETMRRVYEWFTHEEAGYADGAWKVKVAETFLPKILNPFGAFLITDAV